MIPKPNSSDDTESCECFTRAPCSTPAQSRPVNSPHTSTCSNLPITTEEAMALRYANFYNGYNIDYRNDGSWWQSKRKDDCHDRPFRASGQTVDGKGTCCHPQSKEDQCECLNRIIDRLIEDSNCSHKSSDICRKTCE